MSSGAIYVFFIVVLDPPPNPSRNGGERLAHGGSYRAISLIVIQLLFCPQAPSLGRGAHRAGLVYLLYEHLLTIDDVHAALQLIHALTGKVVDLS